MKIVLASSEAVPFIKTGGLGDVIGSLINKYRDMAIEVAVILPLYKKIKKAAKDLNIKPIGKELVVPLGSSFERGRLWAGETAKGASAYFVENDKFYDRDELYGTSKGNFPDNFSRFTFYNRAVLESLKALNYNVDVIHCNDWQTALIPIYIKTIYRNDFPKTATLMTIHNLGYQGLFDSIHMPSTGLGRELFSIDGLEFYNKINFLKGGILFADIITTVSKNYAREILTPEYGCGLHGVLRKRQQDIHGIINGIDINEWDPEHDPFIASNYNINNLKGKNKCKSSLQNECALPVSKAMLIGIVSRLSSQKGINLVADIMNEIMRLGVEVVILGTGEEQYHKTLSTLQKKYPKQLSITIGFDNKLAHRIYAGSDVFLMPSKYEPCGLGQLIALRYGTIPVVRKTGGLADTISEYAPDSFTGTGFLFEKYSPDALYSAIKRAHTFFQDKKHWQALQKNAMSGNFSWHESALKYASLYREALKRLAGSYA